MLPLFVRGRTTFAGPPGPILMPDNVTPLGNHAEIGLATPRPLRSRWGGGGEGARPSVVGSALQLRTCTSCSAHTSTRQELSKGSRDSLSCAVSGTTCSVLASCMAMKQLLDVQAQLWLHQYMPQYFIEEHAVV